MSRTTDEALDLPSEEAAAIAEAIRSEASPVGIDAAKTHVIIIQKLLEIERRLDRIEARIQARIQARIEDRPD
jgi:hypothetical protein